MRSISVEYERDDFISLKMEILLLKTIQTVIICIYLGNCNIERIRNLHL